MAAPWLQHPAFVTPIGRDGFLVPAPFDWTAERFACELGCVTPSLYPRFVSLIRPTPTTSQRDYNLLSQRLDDLERKNAELILTNQTLSETIHTYLFQITPSATDSTITSAPSHESIRSTPLSSESSPSHAKEAHLPPSLFPPSCDPPFTPPSTPSLPSSTLPPSTVEDVKSPVSADAAAKDVKTSHDGRLSEWLRIDLAPLPSLLPECTPDAVAAFALSLHALLPDLAHELILERDGDEDVLAPEFESQANLPQPTSVRRREPPTNLTDACAEIATLHTKVDKLVQDVAGAISDITDLQPTSKKLEREGANKLRRFVGSSGEYDALFRMYKDKVDTQKRREASITTDTATFVAVCALLLKLLSTVATPSGAVAGLSTVAGAWATGIANPSTAAFCKIFERRKKEEEGKQERRNRREAIAKGEEAPAKLEKELVPYKAGDRAGSWVKNVTAALPVAAHLVSVVATKLACETPA
ncbi:hypothetical protein RQP46_006354 [Phenoliferia psychrophenolica]